MKRNSKLSLCLHALGHMARQPDRPMTSEDIARHNATHAVVVRRVLGRLRAAGIVRSDKGHAGGWSLARPADAITVADVYAAIDEPFLRPAPGPRADKGCAIVLALQSTVDEAMSEAEAVLRRHFAGRTVGELARAMDDRGAGLGPEGRSAFPI